MAFKALARTWRPQTFADVVGQQHVLTALVNSLQHNSVHHAYLFTGTRGVGKTSIARLFAKSLNCEQGISASPCGECSSCKAVEYGNYVDLLEIDAASRTKVEDTRELLENVQYRPSIGRYKIYLIDEVHMLSRHSFNALLKTLEEPPEHVKFLLATTDPQKLPITVVSRCLQFQLKAFDQPSISAQLRKILSKEQRPFEENAIDAISEAANGSMRDALSLSDQALALGGGEVKHQQVLSMLGSIDPHQLTQLLCYVVSADADQSFRKLEELADFAPDYYQLHHQLAKLLHQIAMCQVLPGREKNQTLLSLAAQLDPQQLQLYYQIVVNASKDINVAPSPKLAFEMTLLRLLAFVPTITQSIETGVGVQSSQVPSQNLGSQHKSAELDSIELQNSALVQEQDELLMVAQQQGYQTDSTPVAQDQATIAQAMPETVSETRPETRPAENAFGLTQDASHFDITERPEVEPELLSHDDAVQFTNSNLESQTPPTAESVSLDQTAHPDTSDTDEQATAQISTGGQSDQIPNNTQDLVALRNRMRQRGQKPKKIEQGTPATSPQSFVPQTSKEANTGVAQETAKAVVNQQHVSDLQALSPAELDSWWEIQTHQLDMGPIARQMCRSAVLSFNGQWQLLVAPEAQALAKQNSLVEIQEQLGALLALDGPVDLQYIATPQRNTPAMIAQQRHIDKLNAAAQRLQSDPNASFIVHNLGGVLQDQSLHYLD